MPLCLAAGAATAMLAVDAFTLAWVHSIEKTRWEEDWLVEGQQLVVVAARIRGSGAGMEPPPDAVLHAGVWQYRPQLPPLARLVLANSPYATRYELCLQDRCRPLHEYLRAAPAEEALLLAPCAE